MRRLRGEPCGDVPEYMHHNFEFLGAQQTAHSGGLGSLWLVLANIPASPSRGAARPAGNKLTQIIITGACG